MHDLRQRPAAADVYRAWPWWCGIGIALISICQKAVLLGQPDSAAWILRLASVSWADVLFALVFAGLAWLALRWTGRPKMVARATVALGVVVVAFGVSSVGVYQYFNRPLTYDLFKLVEGAAAVRSSIAARITWPLGLSFFLLPVGFVLATRWVAHSSRRCRAVAWSLAGGWLLVGASLPFLSDRFKQRTLLARSPHFEMLRSTVWAIGEWGRPSFASNYPPSDAFEFRPFRDRPSSAAGPHFQPPAGVPRPTNLILIVLESVGNKYMSLYGSPYDTTPHLEAEAAHALVFDDFYANAGFSYAALRPLNFGAYSGLPWSYLPWSGRPLPPTLAALLRERNVRTTYIHNGDLDWGHSRGLLKEGGFETLHGYAELGCEPITSWGAEDHCAFRWLTEWIDEHPGEPFFAVCWTDQTHDPYPLPKGTKPHDFFGSGPRPRHAEDLSRYLTILRRTDQDIGELFETLRQRGLDRNTLVAITGDHGEAFADPHSQRGHAFTVYEEEMRVPLFLWSPALFPGGDRRRQVGAQVDLLPTLADILGVAPAPDWQGHSLFDAAHPRRAFLFSVSGDYLFGLREQNWKYIFGATNGIEYLYDLAQDPSEQHNVVEEHAQIAARQRQRIAAWVNFEEDFVSGRK